MEFLCARDALKSFASVRTLAVTFYCFFSVNIRFPSDSVATSVSKHFLFPLDYDAKLVAGCNPVCCNLCCQLTAILLVWRSGVPVYHLLLVQAVWRRFMQ